MSHTFPMRELFGTFLADGDVANRFRFCEVEPILNKSEEITFDFEGVTNMTDSFCNACFETLAADHPEAMQTKVRFRNCDAVIRHFVGTAVAAGLALARR